MKRNNILIIAFGIIMLISALIFKVFYDSKMPTLNVINNDTNLQVILGGYSWSSFNKTVLADTAAPPMLSEKVTAAKVKLGSTLKLVFCRNPKEIQINLWKD